VLKIWSALRTFENKIIFSKTKCLSYISTRFNCCCCGKAKNWYFWVFLFEFTQILTCWSKVLAQFLHTMKLINYKSCNSSIFIQLIYKFPQWSIFLLDFLWSTKYKLDLYCFDFFHYNCVVYKWFCWHNNKGHFVFNYRWKLIW
jgi:hypothetical protein